METEIWKDVKGFEACYQVSNLGRVKSLPRTYPHAIHTGETITRRGRILRQYIGWDYFNVKLHKNNLPKNINVHRLVALAFCPNPKNKPCVNHKNGNKLDNRAINLEWNTHQENVQHAHRNGLVKHPSGYDNVASKPILQISLSGKFIREWSGKCAAAKALKLSTGNIGMCLSGKRSHTGGFRWKKKEDQSNSMFV